MAFQSWRNCLACVTVGALLTSAAFAADKSAAENGGNNPTKVKAGRLWNLTPEPIYYQLARNSGRPWSTPILLEPGKFHEVRAPREGERSILLGMNQRDRFVGVRFNALGGVIRVRLPARTLDGETVPNWFFVKDANEVPRLVQANTPEQARSEYEQLKKSRPLTAANLDRFKATLRANHVFADQ